jgi:photosystem II stability/assembly factor-like uncharacterized protein
MNTLHILGLAILLPSLALCAPGEWEWQNPLPQGNSLHSVYFLNADTGFIAGEGGAFLRTLDGGASWTFSILPGGGWGQALAFKDVQIGLACEIDFVQGTGQQSNLYRTGDGGRTWDKIMPLHRIRPISWPAGDTVYMAGDSSVLVSRNAGRNWETLRSFSLGVKDISFFTPKLGYVLAQKDDGPGAVAEIFRTSDGGIHFDSVPLPDSVFIYSQDFRDAQNGVIIGGGPTGKVLFKSQDSAKTWTKTVFSDSGLPDLQHIRFSDNLNGVGFGSWSGCIFKTHDGGASWSLLGDKGLYSMYNQTVFPTDRIAYRVSDFGAIEKSRDGGASWSLLNRGILLTTGVLYDVHFADSRNGCAVGIIATVPSQGNQSLILRTTDAGNHWDTVPSPGLGLRSIRFRDAALGITVGDSGSVFRSIDRGATWSSVPRISNEKLVSVRFGDGNDVFAYGVKTLYRSQDAGLTWNKVYADTGFNISSIEFRGSQFGLAVGKRQIGDNIMDCVLRTKDGGASWHESLLNSPLGMPSEAGLKTVHIGPTGIAYTANANGVLYRSTNAGDSWDSISHLGLEETMSLSFVGVDTGFALSNDGIRRTVDGGKVWDLQIDPAPYRLAAMSFAIGGDGYAVGGFGSILRYNRGTTSIQKLAESRFMPKLIMDANGAHYHLDSRSSVSAAFMRLDGSVVSSLKGRLEEPGDHFIGMPLTGCRPLVLELAIGEKRYSRMLSPNPN